MKTLLIFLVLGLNLYAGISEGDKAPNFTLKTLDGKKFYSMNNLKGKVVLVNLWASWCKGCKKEMPEFFELQKSYKKDFQLLTINLDDKPKKAQIFLKSVENKIGMKTPFISLYDPSKAVAKAYQCSAMPSSYLIDKHGKIQSIIVGSLDANDIAQLKLDINKLK
jgi:peroxiredoxin